MLIIGGGVIGLEMGSIWRRLGANVTVIEFLDHILDGMDREISKQMLRILKKQGLKFKFSSRVTKIEREASGVKVFTSSYPNDEEELFLGDVVLLATGRKPHTRDLDLNSVGINLDANGFILVDNNFQTTSPGIFAIGDVIGGQMLAHKAEEEGVAIAEILAGEAGHVDYHAIPSIVYTWPEVAAVGKTEEQLLVSKTEYNIGKFPFTANSRACANGDNVGFVKILTEKSSDMILGSHIIGPNAGDLIQEIVLAISLGASGEDIGRICHGHPGLPEAIKEAALNSNGRAIHI